MFFSAIDFIDKTSIHLKTLSVMKIKETEHVQKKENQQTHGVNWIYSCYLYKAVKLNNIINGNSQFDNRQMYKSYPCKNSYQILKNNVIKIRH